jgi:thiamine-monophosphate kinase
MKIHEIGGEFALINRLAGTAPAEHPDLVAGIGDDAAVIDSFYPGQESLLVTTDMLVDNRHFRQDWATPFQIGKKAVACNASDIAAMGGSPTFMFVSIALTENMETAWVEELYRGMSDVCRQHGIVLAGGDTTCGDVITISITLMGRATKQNLSLRSDALPNDILCVTGPLGASAAGFHLLNKGLTPPDPIKLKHLTPGCRLDVSPFIAPLAGAMIDISDGLAAEAHHICDQSGVGVEIYADRIPIDPLVKAAAATMGCKPMDFALSGGEDFELLFSISAENLQKLKAKKVDAFIVGKVMEASAGRTLILPEKKRVTLSGGYDHFR